MSYLHEDIRKPGEHQSFKAPQRYGNTEIDGNTGTARSSFTGAARMTTSDNPAQGQEHVENNKKYEYGPPVSETFVAHQIYPQGPQVPTGVGALTQAPGGNGEIPCLFVSLPSSDFL